MDLKKVLKTGGMILAAAVGLWAFLTWLLPLTAPFLAAFLLAVVTEPAALWLMEKGKLPRWAAGAICMFGVYFLLFCGLFLLGKSLFGALGEFTARLPRLLEQLGPVLEQLRSRLLSAASRLPDGLGAGLTAWTEDFFRSGGQLLEGLPRRLLQGLTALFGKLPRLALTAVTTVAASFMTAAQLPRLRAWLSRVLPKTWRKKVTVFWGRAKAAAMGWVKAQGKLMAITFLLTAAGLLVLRARRPILLAAGIAAVDALPVFGSGVVLLPWAMGCFLGGNMVRGAGLVLLYGAAALTRLTMEPRLVGRQMGLPPIATLAAIYIGGKLCGVGGMILFPVAASILGQLVRLRKG